MFRATDNLRDNTRLHYLQKIGCQRVCWKNIIQVSLQHKFELTNYTTFVWNQLKSEAWLGMYSICNCMHTIWDISFFLSFFLSFLIIFFILCLSFSLTLSLSLKKLCPFLSFKTLNLLNVCVSIASFFSFSQCYFIGKHFQKKTNSFWDQFQGLTG